MAAAFVAASCVAGLLSTTTHLQNTFMGYTKFGVNSKLKSNGKPNRRYTLHRYRSKLQPSDRCSFIQFSCDHEVMSQCFLLIITAH